MKIRGLGQGLTFEQSLLAIAGGQQAQPQPAAQQPAAQNRPQPAAQQPAQPTRPTLPATSPDAERARREAAAAEAERKRVEAERKRKEAEMAAEAARKAQAAAAEAELRRQAQAEADRLAAEERKKLDSLNQELTANAQKALAPKDTGLVARLLLGAGGGFAVGGPPGAIIGAAALALLGRPKDSTASVPAPAAPARPAVGQSQQILVDPGFNVTPPPSATTGRPESVAPPVSGGRQPAPGAQLPGAGTSVVTSKPAAPTGFNPVASGVRMPLRGLHDVPVELYVENLKVE